MLACARLIIMTNKPIRAIWACFPHPYYTPPPQPSNASPVDRSGHRCVTSLAALSGLSRMSDGRLSEFNIIYIDYDDVIKPVNVARDLGVQLLPAR